jgi:hypothetical protein
MPDHQELATAAAPASSLRHLSLSLTGQIQTQAMSHAKFLFLIALVVFFIVLFVAAYVWMRRPDFGQKGAHPIPAPSVVRDVSGVPGETRADDEAPRDAASRGA